MSNPITVQELRARLDGEIVTPSDETWDEARQAWNLAVDQRPAAVVYAESADDVVATVDFARVRGLRVAPQGTGHNAAPLGPLAETVLLETSRMRAVAIDPESRTARVEAGVLWLEVVEAAAEHGLAALAGSSPDVGVVGYTLGGGLSWLARKFGIAGNSVTAVELVTADGRLVRADSDNEPELFWALRGGGGSFGVVTALEFRLYPLAEVYAGWLFFPIERAEEVLYTWRWTLDSMPDEMTLVARFLRVPQIPEVPERLRGRAFVVVEGIYAGDEADGAELIRPLRELGPELNTFATIPMPALSHLHMDPEHPVPGAGDGMMLADLPTEAIDRLIEAEGGGVGDVAPLGRDPAPRRCGRRGEAGARGARLVRRALRPLRGRDRGDRRDEGDRRGARRGRPEGARAVGRRARVPQLRGALDDRTAALRERDVRETSPREGAVRPAGRDPLEPPDPTGPPGGAAPAGGLAHARASDIGGATTGRRGSGRGDPRSQRSGAAPLLHSSAAWGGVAQLVRAAES